MRSPPGRRRVWWVAVAVALAAAGIVGGLLTSSSSSSSPEPSSGSPGPTGITPGGGEAAAIELANVRDGAPAVSLASLSGRPVVLNFWASWCVPCAKELPAFQAVADQTKDKVAFVGVNHQDSRRAAQEMLDQTGVEFPSGYDPQGEVARSYGLRGMPTTVFISASGRVLERRNGEMSGAELRQAIDRLFGRATRAS